MKERYWADCDGTKISPGQMIEGYYDHLLLHLDEIQELLPELSAVKKPDE